MALYSILKRKIQIGFGREYDNSAVRDSHFFLPVELNLFQPSYPVLQEPDIVPAGLHLWGVLIKNRSRTESRSGHHK
jgi:hypothetical protein